MHDTHTIPATLRERADSDGRTVEVRIMPWDTVVDTPEGRESFARGAFAGVNPRSVTIESQRHGGTLVGRGDELVEHDDAAYLFARVSETPAGDELLTLIRDGVVTQASVAFEPRKTRRSKGVLVREAVDLWRVAILERGNYPGAGVVALRGKSEGTDVVEEVIDEGRTVREAMAPLVDQVAALDDRVSQLTTLSRVPDQPIQYRAMSLGQLLYGAWDQHEEGKRLLQRALVDQITSANPGVMPPGVVANAALIINRGRPAIDAQGGAGELPASGMTVQWPVMTTPLTGLIAKQATQKAAVVSALVSFGNATAGIQTFAGASDIAYQLIRRSDPPYLEGYARAMLAAYAGITDQQFTVDVLAAATSSQLLTPASTQSAIIAAMVDASLKVQAATGEPATAVVVAADLFAAIAKAMAPTAINPTSVGGTALASTLRVNVSGLNVTADPYLAAGTGWISNSLAARWLEDGPFQITVDDAEKIGQNVAYWGLGASQVTVPAGVVKIVAV